MKRQLTIAIVTKNRLQQLTRCLGSLAVQTVTPERVLIIDNDSAGSAKAIYQQFQKQLPIDYIREARPGVAAARNRAIMHCKTTLLGFIDDDCVMDPNWIQAALAASIQLQADFIIGRSELFNTKSIIARMQQIRYSYWFFHDIKKDGITSPYIFDTKNLVMNVQVLKKYQVRFHTSFSLGKYDSSDTDFGFQLARLKKVGRYCSKMVVFHEESSHVFSVIRKAYYRGRLGFRLSKKWDLFGKMVYLPYSNLYTWIREEVFHWPREYQRFIHHPFPHHMKVSFLEFVLIKLYDQVYLHGYIDECRTAGMRLPFNKWVRYNG